MQNSRYPHIHVRSKTELAKRLSRGRFKKENARALIDDSLVNFDKYWRDHPKLSDAEQQKWVRDASNTNLGRLLKRINKDVLSPYDSMLPGFLFGGISGRSHKAAVKHLLGNKRGRMLLKLDISRFYEQISQQRVEQFFGAKASCGSKGAKLFGKLCCVPFGTKGTDNDRSTIARGFATSSRLAVWCNLDTFIKLERLVQHELRGKDPRIAIYVDDIGITASRVSIDELIQLYPKIEAILQSDPNQPLPLNTKKTQIIKHSGETYDIHGKLLGLWAFEHLGVKMNRNSLGLGSKTRWKLIDIRHRVNSSKKPAKGIKKTKKSLNRYKRFIEN